MLLNAEKSLREMGDDLKKFPWDNRFAYAWFLSQTYYYVCHSTRLLHVAIGRMKQNDHEFCRRFTQHLKEENGHEAIALKDLRRLGFDIEDFPELPETRMFWETQYYKIEHNDPLSLLGYIYALEAIACEICPIIKRELEKHYDKDCHSFIKVHGEDDPEHVEKALEQIRSLPKERLRWVQENFEQSTQSYRHFLDAILRVSALEEHKEIA